jgi:hypothetical protein
MKLLKKTIEFYTANIIEPPHTEIFLSYQDLVSFGQGKNFFPERDISGNHHRFRFCMSFCQLILAFCCYSLQGEKNFSYTYLQPTATFLVSKRGD